MNRYIPLAAVLILAFALMTLIGLNLKSVSAWEFEVQLDQAGDVTGTIIPDPDADQPFNIFLEERIEGNFQRVAGTEQTLLPPFTGSVSFTIDTANVQGQATGLRVATSATRETSDVIPLTPAATPPPLPTAPPPTPEPTAIPLPPTGGRP